MKNSIPSSEFNLIFQDCKSLKVGDLLFRVGIKEGRGIGFVVSKKYGNAVKRNLFRRRVKNIFSKHGSLDNPIIIQPLQKNINNTSIKICINQFLQKNA